MQPRKMIKEIVEDPIVGQVYEGKVVKLMDFGAFVNFYGKRDGLVHVSQISEDRVNHPKDVLNEGETVKVKLMGIDDRGKSKLSMKVIDQSTGKEYRRKVRLNPTRQLFFHYIKKHVNMTFIIV